MTNTISSEGSVHGSPSVAGWVFGIVAVWFAAALGASLSGLFASPAGALPLPLLAAVALPILAFFLVYGLAPAFRSFVQGLDLRPLILIHSWRFVGLSFLILAAYGVLPLVFAVPAGVGDAVAAAGALVTGISLYSPGGASRKLVAGWNAFGLADFVIAVTVGALAGSGGVLNASGAVSTAAMGTFPLSLIPGFLVPLFVITHLIIHFQLKARSTGEQKIRVER